MGLRGTLPQSDVVHPAAVMALPDRTIPAGVDCHAEAGVGLVAPCGRAPRASDLVAAAVAVAREPDSVLKKFFRDRGHGSAHPGIAPGFLHWWLMILGPAFLVQPGGRLLDVLGIGTLCGDVGGIGLRPPVMSAGSVPAFTMATNFARAGFLGFGGGRREG